ncbi:MAG: patatin-like phospholipase family protein [Pseudoxanthomonas suwonensis]|nr:patatin-like phospholipase family protein [Pseudoxanthomonas suwonensis]
MPDKLHAAIARYPVKALVLQGGGALGGYQCGAYEAMHEAGVLPDWFSGISIGAINAAIMAGNAPAERLPQLRRFWETVAEPAGPLSAWAVAVRGLIAAIPDDESVLGWGRDMSALGALTQGQRGFFRPRMFSPFLFADGSEHATSFYDTTPLRETLLSLVDFERINADSGVRLTVGAASVTTGNFRYFDSAREPIHVDHVMASGALPPAFPAVEIDGDAWWDGGIVSNTPLEYVLECHPHGDTLAFQVDLWPARGRRPQSMLDVHERVKEIRFSSRTRHGTRMVQLQQKLQAALLELVELLPERKLPAHLQDTFAPYLDDRVFNIVHLIYQSKSHERQSKDYAFGLIPLREHWETGLRDTRATLAHADYFTLPDRTVGFAVHDVHRERGTGGEGRGTSGE